MSQNTAISVIVNLDSTSVGKKGFGIPLLCSEIASDLLVGGSPSSSLRYREYSSSAEIDSDAVQLGASVVAILKLAFSQQRRPKKIALGRKKSTDASFAAALTEIAMQNNSWYGFCINSRTADSIVAAAVDTSSASYWAQNNDKLFVAQTSQADSKNVAYNSSNAHVLDRLKARNLFRTVAIWHNSDTEFVDWAVLCNRLSIDPDIKSAGWRYVTLSGVTEMDSTVFSSTDMGVVNDKSGNYYTPFFGVGSFAEGKSSGGQPVDLRITADWLQARIQEACAQVLLDAAARGDRIPYDDRGLRAFSNVTSGVLGRGVNAGHLIEGTTFVDMPALADIPTSDRTARVLNFSFGAQPTGGIEEVAIEGYVSVNVAVPTA